MPVLSDAASLALFAFAVALVTGGACWGSARLLARRFWSRAMSRPELFFAWIAITMLLTGVGAFLFGVYVEADWLSTTFVTMESPKLARGQRLRIVHLTDLHADGQEQTLRRLPGELAALAPDLVVFTGDALNRADALPTFRDVVSRLGGRLGRFAVKGNHDVWYWDRLDLFGGGVAKELDGRVTTVDEGRIALCGAPYGLEPLVLRCLHDAPATAFRIAAFHTPDLAEDFGDAPPDLYLAGHTHGGQVRAPLYGAIVTLARHGKKYEMGRYQVGPTTLFVSRGIGFEPGAPRVRFLCRPEIAVIDVTGTR